MNTLKKIQYNCRHATFLIEKKQHIRLTVREYFDLGIHLAGCSVCRLFERQSKMINRMVNALFQDTRSELPPLDEGFKKDLEKRIVQEMNKN